MYHIKKDKRQLNSAANLVNALAQCLKTKHISNISVSELCSKAGISRSTFYRIFDTPVDVLGYACDSYIDKAVKDFLGKQFRDDEDLIRFTLQYWYENYEMLEAAINSGRLDIVRKSFESHSTRLIPLLRQDFSEMELDYIRQGAVGLISNLLLVWIRRGKKESPGQMFDLYKKFLSLLGEHK